MTILFNSEVLIRATHSHTQINHFCVNVPRETMKAK